MIEPDKLALWASITGMLLTVVLVIRHYRHTESLPPAPFSDSSQYLLHQTIRNKDTIIMALLDDIAAQAAAIEATDAAAAAKIDDLTSRLAAANAAIEASKGDVDAANALAARLKAANDALQAKVAA